MAPTNGGSGSAVRPGRGCEVARLGKIGTCVFCGDRREYTQEHVIPRWVRRTLRTGPIEITDRRTNARLRYDQTLTLASNSAVCRECNSGHMSRLEQRVRRDAGQMIVGEPVALTRPRAQAISAWITERVLLMALATNEIRERRREPPQSRWVGEKSRSTFEWLYAHRDEPSPPPGTQVWLAYLDATTRLPAWSLVGTWPEAADTPDGYLCGFSIGCLLVLAFGQDFRKADHLAPDGRALGRLELPREFAGYLVPTWPEPDELAVWPPRFGLANTDLTEVGRLLTTAIVKRQTHPPQTIRLP